MLTNEAFSIRYYGTVICLGMARGISSIAPLAKDLKDAGNRIIAILGASVESDLLWEQAIGLVSDEMIVSALDGSRGPPLHVGHPLLTRLNQGKVNLDVAVGLMDEIEKLRFIVEEQNCVFVTLAAKHSHATDSNLSF